MVIREQDTLKLLLEKVELATILGTMQATLTDFKNISSEWKENTEEEALLGVSLTGIFDNKHTRGEAPFLHEGREVPLSEALDLLRERAVAVNAEWAQRFGIRRAAAITCVKPSGTVSQLVDCASGIHPRYGQYYIRTVRGNLLEPITKFLIAQGIPHEPENGKPNTVVFSFPISHWWREHRF